MTQEYCFETINWSPITGHPPVDLDLLSASAAQAGFRWISFDSPLIDAHLAGGGTIEGLRRTLDDHQIKLLALHSFLISDDIQQVQEAASTSAERCGALGGRFVNSAIMAPIDDAVAASAGQLAQACRDHGVRMAIEPLSFSALPTIVATLELLRRAGIPDTPMVLDAWQFFAGDNDWKALSALSPDQVGYVQFSDHAAVMSDDLFEETLNRRLLPGEGSLDLARFARTMREIGYAGPVGPEILSRTLRAWPIATYAAAAMASTSQLWS